MQLSAFYDATSARLRAAGVASPDNDARILLAEVLGFDSPMDVLTHPTIPLSDAQMVDAERLVARRETREPLQHILGSAPFGPLDLSVGPGVFVPRPETEVLADWGVKSLASMAGSAAAEGRPLRVVDLCTGSGALALYVDALVRPTADNAWLTPRALRAKAGRDVEIRGVDKSEVALGYARRNARGTGVEMIEGDVTKKGLLADWRGTVDVVVTNPPYVPESNELDPEVYADPHEAVFAGSDGMSVIPGMLPQIRALLRVGGVVGIEHDDTTSAAVVRAVRASGGFGDVATLEDLTGRNRFVTASKIS